MSETSTVTERVIDIIAEQFGTDAKKLAPETNLSFFVPDDLDILEIVMECEDEFGIFIADGLYDNLSTIAQVIEMVEKVSAEQL